MKNIFSLIFLIFISNFLIAQDENSSLQIQGNFETSLQSYFVDSSIDATEVPERVLNNAAVEKLLEKEKELGSNIKFEDIMDEVAGVYPKVMLDGEMEAGAWSCGMVVGLINDIPSCKELIDGIMDEADRLITKRLEGMLSA